ncbi:hypothetical protein FO519_004020 [Halicephalobus sp. NKZ332]|nr:hypothetical protein FO519_004020 [Halicephalobus sp. NKZ332]
MHRYYSQPPPPPLLRFDYGNGFPQGPQQQFNGFGGNSNFHPPGIAPSPQQNIQQNTHFPSVSNVVPVQSPQYPVQQQQYPIQQIQNPQPVNNNNLPRLPPMIPELQKPPIIVNTLIQVFLDGKNKSIGDMTLERKIMTEAHKNDRIVLTREFDTKTLTFVEENGNNEHNQDNLISVKGTAVTNSTGIDKDDLASELERELENAIPVILEELGKKEKSKPQETMIKEDKTTGVGKVSIPPEDDDVNAEDLEKLIREGLDELDEGEAKKQLEKEFNEVIHSSPPPPQTQARNESHEQNKTTTLPPGIVTLIVDLEPITTTTQSSSAPTVVTPGPTEMMTPIKSFIEKSKEDVETSTRSEEGQTPEPTEMIVPEKAMVVTSVEESIDEEVTATPEPVEMMVPEHAMTVESGEGEETSESEEITAPIETIATNSEEGVETTHTPVTTKTITTESGDEETFNGDQTSTLGPAETTISVQTTTTKSEEKAVEDQGSTSETVGTTVPVQTMVIKSGEVETTHIHNATETIVPVKAITAESKEVKTVDKDQPSTSKPAENIAPIHVTVMKSNEEGAEITHAPVTTKTIIPEQAKAPESKEESTDTLHTTTEAVEDVEKVNEPLTKTPSEQPETSTSLLTTSQVTTEEIKTTIKLPISQEPCEIPNDESDTTKGDVLFLLDSSSSIGPEQFQKAVRLVSQTVLNFNNIGPTGIQISLVQYNREPFLEFSFRRHNCLSSLLEDINDTEFMNGVSNLGRALEKVMKFAFTQSRGDRPDAENVLVLLTDGLSDDEIQHPITLSRQNGTTPIVVSTLQAKKDILMGIVEDDHNNVFNLTEAVQKPIGERLAQRIREILRSNQIAEKVDFSTVAAIIPITNDAKKSNHVPQQSELNPSPVEIEVTAAPIIPMLPTKDDSVTVECSNDGITATFQLPEKFAGTIVAKDHSSDLSCTKEVEQVDSDSQKDRSVTMKIKIGTCGLNVINSTNPSGIQHSIVLNVLHNKEIITAKDKAFILECFRPHGVTDTTLETKLDIEGGPPHTKTISLTVVPPKCKYTLRKDSLNGPIIQYARIGQVIYHRWECDGENVTNSVYGLYIHNCKATNRTKHDFKIINEEGCSVDPTIVNEITYADGKLLAFAKSYVFTLTDVTTLLFSCKVSLCVRDGDGCEGYSPPVCPSSNMSDVLLTRRIRHYDSALEAALTSELNTEIVDVSDPLTATRIHQLHLPVLLVILTAVIVGSFFGVVWHFCSADRTLAKVGTCLRSLGLCPTQAQVNALTQQWSKNSRISIEEFLPIYNDLKKEVGLFDEELIGMLSNFDREGNGLIHIADLRHILVNTGEKLTEVETELLLQGVEGPDGKVNISDFVRMITSA